VHTIEGAWPIGPHRSTSGVHEGLSDSRSGNNIWPQHINAAYLKGCCLLPVTDIMLLNVVDQQRLMATVKAENR